METSFQLLILFLKRYYLSMNIEETLQNLPNSPGVYIMKDGEGAIIYVGKARNLRQRVRSYFRASGDSRYHVAFLVARINSIDTILTDTEKEALLLENTLIKQHHPRYNLDLKDDKTYFSVRINPKEQFPRFTVVRKQTKDGARYFGPYSSASSAREVLQQLIRIFPLRHYPLKTCLSRKRPCLYHQIGQCSAPCHALISTENYGKLVEGATLFLEGKGKQLIAEFKSKMLEASEQMNYEEAVRWRNLLRSIEITVEKQKVVTRGGDSDVIGYVREENTLALALLYIRSGVLTGSRQFSFKWELDDAQGIASFLTQHYVDADSIPDEILLPLPCQALEVLTELLHELKGKNVVIHYPLRGTKRELVKMATKNAQQAQAEEVCRQCSSEVVIKELYEKLNLTKLPRRIECYDISTIQGRYSVGSGVAFWDGVPDKSGYRHYRIRSVEGQDDFAMLKELFERRFKEDSISKNGVPDLVVVDGGMGQLNATAGIVQELGLTGEFDLISLAKSRVESRVRDKNINRSDERVFLPGRKNPIVLKQSSKSLLLLSAIRDEAHRFAITYHRKLRSKEGIASELDKIAGIGKKRRIALLTHFGSLQKVMEATLEELCKVDGITRNLAEKLFSSKL